MLAFLWWAALNAGQVARRCEKVSRKKKEILWTRAEFVNKTAHCPHSLVSEIWCRDARYTVELQRLPVVSYRSIHEGRGGERGGGGWGRGRTGREGEGGGDGRQKVERKLGMSWGQQELVLGRNSNKISVEGQKTLFQSTQLV